MYHLWWESLQRMHTRLLRTFLCKGVDRNSYPQSANRYFRKFVPAKPCDSKVYLCTPKSVIFGRNEIQRRSTERSSTCSPPSWWHVSSLSHWAWQFDLALQESVVIYCRTIKTTEMITALLKDVGYEVVAYHGNMSNSERTAVHKSFIFDHIRLIVATGKCSLFCSHFAQLLAQLPLGWV